MEPPRWTDEDPVSRDQAEKLKVALFRQDVLDRYTNGVKPLPGVVSGPASGLRVAIAQCDHLALIAVSRNVREMGLDVERGARRHPVRGNGGRILRCPLPMGPAGHLVPTRKGMEILSILDEQ